MSAERTFLSRLRLSRFGKFHDRSIGPLSSQLTVLHGANEAGKSTTRALISQVLFGWDRKTAGTSHYGLEGENRKGSLTFEGPSGEWELARMERAGNQTSVTVHAGMPWDSAFEDLTSGLDKETYASVFAFDSDQLRALESKGEVGEKLTTAQSATPISPVEARKALSEEITQYTSSSQTATRSIPQLRKRITEVKQEIAELLSQERDRTEDQNALMELEARIVHLVTRLRDSERVLESENRVSAEIVSLLGQYREVGSELETQSGELAALELELDALEVDESALSVSARTLVLVASREDDERLVSEMGDARRELERLSLELSSNPLSGCRCDDSAQSALTQLAGREAKTQERINQRKAELDREVAQLEGNRAAAEVRLGDHAATPTRAITRDIIVALALASVGMLAVAVLAATGQTGFMWVPLGLSLLLVGYAIVRGIVAGGVTAGTSSAPDDLMRIERVRESERRVSEANSLLDAAHRDFASLNTEIAAALAELGLADGGTDLTIAAARIQAERAALRVREDHARAVEFAEALDARWAEKSSAMISVLEVLGAPLTTLEPQALFVAIDAARARCEHAQQVAATRQRVGDRLESVRRGVEREQARLQVIVSRLASLIQLPAEEVDVAVAESYLHGLQDRISETRVKIEQDTDARETLLQEKSQIIGSLKAAERDRNLSEKLAELEQLQSLLSKYADELAVLVLARHIIDQSMARWGSERQPEIYRRASEVFRELTENRWYEIRSGEKPGEFLAVDADRVVRKPSELSTATVQQLYLALRIALLQANPEVGAELPVVMDDPFVHFDEGRRKCAVAAVAGLSKSRQVLFFTQDPETAELVARAAPDVTSIRL